jgi:3-oxoacyl-[acyl-carrier protein] reductase
MLLSNKRALIYGGGGAIGGAVARVFARGAELFLAGRTVAKLDAVAGAIADAGFRGAVRTAQVDALDPASVDAHMDDVVATAGGVDVSFNVISDRAVQGTPMVEMDADEYVEPLAAAVRTFFLTSRAAARVMRRQLSGELGAEGVRVATLKTGGVPESMPESMGARRSAIAGSIVDATLLGRAATLEDVGNAAAFAASDLARTVTAATVNISCGTFMD